MPTVSFPISEKGMLDMSGQVDRHLRTPSRVRFSVLRSAIDRMARAVGPKHFFKWKRSRLNRWWGEQRCGPTYGQLLVDEMVRDINESVASTVKRPSL
jgi:hypothetical protein